MLQLFIVRITSWLRDVLDHKLAEDHERAVHIYLRRIDGILAHQRSLDRSANFTLAERLEFGNEVVEETERLSTLAKAHVDLSHYYRARAKARIGPCEDCRHFGRRIIKDDHHGGVKWVCPDRIDCHARRGP